jgi:hypothetical protein
MLAPTSWFVTIALLAPYAERALRGERIFSVELFDGLRRDVVRSLRERASNARQMCCHGRWQDKEPLKRMLGFESHSRRG